MIAEIRLELSCNDVYLVVYLQIHYRVHELEKYILLQKSIEFSHIFVIAQQKIVFSVFYNFSRQTLNSVGILPVNCFTF